jgi:hypothetical protein
MRGFSPDFKKAFAQEPGVHAVNVILSKMQTILCLRLASKSSIRSLFIKNG